MNKQFLYAKASALKPERPGIPSERSSKGRKSLGLSDSGRSVLRRDSIDGGSERKRGVIDVLYEDELFICFNKPPGLLVIPAPGYQEKTLTQIVNMKTVSAALSEMKRYPCHRLDRDTSGVILFAKGKRIQKFFMDFFKEHRIQKKYVAFIQGHLEKNSGIFKSVIKDFDQIKFQPHQSGKEAITHYCVLERRKGFSVVEVEPLTGRTNQIRIHFAGQHHPLVGDRKYAFARDYPLRFRRTALHAAVLSWPHPKTGKMIEVHAPLAEDMVTFLDRNK